MAFLDSRPIELVDAIHPLSDRLELFFFQAEDGIRDGTVTEVQTCALPISDHRAAAILRFVPQLYVIAVEFSRFGRIGKLLFESGWGTVRRMRVGRVRIEKERLVAMLFQRSEERRVGKECRSGWWAGDEKKK